LRFNNKYRIPSARLQHWNYANEAMYFVTICTKNRVNYFGEIIDGRDAMHRVSTPILRPTEIGEIAHLEWHKSAELRPDMNLELGEFVVMPNHIHGIVIIGANDYNTPGAPEYKNQFAPQSKNLASILRGYKSAVTTYARKNSIEFNWQPRFHDHITFFPYLCPLSPSKSPRLSCCKHAISPSSSAKERSSTK
jgi:putative transposase